MPNKLTALIPSFAFATLLVAACGGGTPESTTPPPQPSATATTAQTTTPPPDPEAHLEAQREHFIGQCMGKSQAKEYCECGFEQFKIVFKNADLDAKPSEEQLEELKTKTIAACADKLPEAPIKASFVTSCNGSEARKAGYCECAWTSLRKNLSLGDFAAGLNGPKFDDAKKKMVVDCKGKLPDAVVKAEFMGACSKDAAHTKACECIWKKVRGKFSAEEVAAGIADLKAVPGVDACKGK